MDAPFRSSPLNSWHPDCYSALFRWVPSALGSGETKGEALFLCSVVEESKNQMFHVKLCACFSQSHMLSFFQATVSCTVSAAVEGGGGERLNHLEGKSKILLVWAFPVWVWSFGGCIKQVRVAGAEGSIERIKYSCLREHPWRGHNFPVHSGWDGWTT